MAVTSLFSLHRRTAAARKGSGATRLSSVLSTALLSSALLPVALLAPTSLGVAQDEFPKEEAPESAQRATPSDELFSFPTAERDNPQINPLLEEAQRLFDGNRPIDGRAKLLEALKLAPEDYRPHMALGGYYLSTVANFQLAFRYLRTAEELFLKQYGSEKAISKNPKLWRQHARLLILLTETRINLDNYQGALETMDRFESLYSTMFDWYPGTRAWVLMKLRRIDEAIRVAQAGLLAGADPGRTYNILGILISIKGNRSLALEAFAQAIRAEAASFGDVSTPLNNAGEVYRESFSDNLAETAWRKAIQLPDGCEHILFSLNLSMLYVEQLRLFQAERVLSDFEACFAQHSIRADTEHRALLALARGRIALHQGDIEKAHSFLTLAAERQQWFGKIGTDEADLRFASTVAMNHALSAERRASRDTVPNGLSETIRLASEQKLNQLRSWWLGRRATEIALDELRDFEDLWVRNTDAMLEYPTLGSLFPSFPTTGARRRLKEMRSTDPRPQAKPFYDVYEGWNLLAHGDEEGALTAFRDALNGARPSDRLLTSEALSGIVLALNARDGWLFSLSPAEAEERREAIERLFLLLPSQIRYRDLTLPVQIETRGEGTERIQALLFRRRFEENPRARFKLLLIRGKELSSGEAPPAEDSITLIISDTATQQNIVSLREDLSPGEEGEREVANKLIAKSFLHRVDPPGEPLAELEILNRAYHVRD